ncbi:MAG TPA: glycosyltransferase family 39 protein [Candidatus Acidoferrales bacterium]|nr:glycosyltransferase family 39 protein [Candidatus Acidoferrales bacterium]
MRTRGTLFWMVTVALVLRLTVMLFVYRQSFDPRTDYWSFGFEEGRVARALASGQGFSNPLYAPTGPTAWFAPIYPAILAGVFKIFGIYTKAACLAILSLNSLISALTCIPIFLFARKSFSEGIALLAGWIWAFFPDAVYGPNNRIWDTWLGTLLLAILFYMALRLAESDRVRDWIAYGLLSGVAALTSPVLLSVLPFLALWALWRLRSARMRWFAPALSCMLATILVISPWLVRNYRVFHRFIPLRDDLGLELAVGNSGDSRFTEAVDDGPWLPEGQAQWNDYRRLGETKYFDRKFHEGLTYVEQHPVWYAWMVARRIVNVWTNFWSFSKSYRQNDPFAPITVPLYTLLSALTLLGLWRAFREKGGGVATPYAIVLFFFPIVYYVTHTRDWYRRPIDPFFVALAAGAIVAWRRKRETRTTQGAERAHLN